MKSPWLWRAAALLFVASMVLVGLGDPLLLQTDEGFAANRAMSLYMYDSALVTYDDPFIPQFNKPPLFYWLVAIFYRAIGFNTWAVRLPTALFSIGVCALLYLINRRYFSERIALLSAVLVCTIPFCLFHARTAMLEMPLIFFILLTIYLLAYARPATWAAALAGVACAAAFMIKGAAALIALPAALIVSLIRRRFTLKTWWHLPIFFIAGLAPMLAYYLALPREYADLFFDSLFHNEDSGNLSAITLDGRWPSLYLPLIKYLRWHIPAAVAGFILILAGLRKNPRIMEWLILALLLCAPTAVVGLKMVNPFTRYFLIMYPFILTLSAFFALETTRSPRTAWLLLPFALACPFVEQSGWAWIPAGTAVLVLALAQILRFTGWSLSPLVMQSALIMAIAVPSSFSGAAREVWNLPPRLQAEPIAIRFAEKARGLLAEHDVLVFGGSGYKKHDIFFYSRRPCIGIDVWLREYFKPGAETVGIFYKADMTGIPGIRASVLDQEGPWKLLKIQASNDVAATHGIVLVGSGGRNSVRNTLKLLNVRFTDFPRGFMITGLPDCPDTPCPRDGFRQQLVRLDGDVPAPGPEDGIVTLDRTHALDLHFPAPVLVCGIDVAPASRSEVMTGLKLEFFDSPSGAWRELRRINEDFYDRFDIKNGRLRKTSDRALRVRFEPIQTARVRISQSGDQPLRFSVRDLYVNRGEPPEPAPSH